MALGRWMANRTRISLLLIAALLAGLVSVPVTAWGDPAGPAYFQESFEGAVNQWDGTPWAKETDASLGSRVGVLDASGAAYPTVRAKPSNWTNYETAKTDYEFRFKAKYGDAASGAPKYARALFRYNTASSSANYYYFEFRQIGTAVYFGKYADGVDSRIGNTVNVSALLSNFSFNAWHDYAISVKGNEFELRIDGVLVAVTPADTSHTGGTIGFGAKNATLRVDNVETIPYVDHSPLSLAFSKELPTYTYYNADVTGKFTVPNATGPVTAAVYYRYGSEPGFRTAAVEQTGGEFNVHIPGTPRASSVSYALYAYQGTERVGRYPQTGENVLAVRPFNRYYTDFESDTVGSVPPNWSVQGNQPDVSVADDEGKKVLRFGNSVSGQSSIAKFVHPFYGNLDNFTVTFKAKYKRTNPDPNASYNLWRLRYRNTAVSHNTVEWSTHNAKYIMFRKAPLGPYQNGSYYQSLIDGWHEYKLEAAGVNHRLYIDGVKVVDFQDVDEQAPTRGGLQFETIGGLELEIDDLEIKPLDVPYTFYALPSGDFSGVFEQSQPKGIDVTLIGGNTAGSFTVGYSVAKADGDKAVVASGQRTYAVNADERKTDTIPFQPVLQQTGTYDVTTELYVNGVKADQYTKRMRIAVIKQAAPTTGLDLDNESPYGFNTGYDLSWDEDLLRSIAKMGVKHARQELNWALVDKNNGSYDWTTFDEIVNKFGQYGINVTPIMGIPYNGAYDANGVVDTAQGLKGLGDFTRTLVQRYKDRIRQWEMPNEPELGVLPYTPQEIVQLQKTFYVNMKQADPDAVLMAGDHTSGAVNILPGELELGSYDYADAFSYHRYTYGVMPDGFIQNQTNGVKQLLNDLGGWKDLYVSESGWPTALAGYPSVSQEVQRDYAVRGYLIDRIIDQTVKQDHFTWKNAGFDDNFYNTSFGVTDGDGRPKLAYVALHNLMTTLDQSLYAGKVDTGDASVEAHLFLNDNEPIVALWKKVNYGNTPPANAPTSPVVLPAYGANGSVTKIDVNGNESQLAVANGTVALQAGGSPVYVRGLGTGSVYASAATLLAEKKAEAAGKLEASGPAGSTAAAASVAELARIHTNMANALAAVQPAARAAGIEQAIKDVYALMSAVAGHVAGNVLDRNKAYVALESLYNYAERASVSLIRAKQEQQVSSVQLDYAAKLGTQGTSDAATARYAYDHKIGAFGLMPVSTSAVMRANRYGRIAEQASASSRYAKSYVYNMLAREFAGAVQSIVASEPVRSTAVMASATPLNSVIEADESSAVTVSLTNRRSVSQTATVNWSFPAGWEQVQTQPVTSQISIGGGQTSNLTYAIKAPANAAKGLYDVNMQLVLDGKPVDSLRFKLNVADAIQAKLLPVTAPVSSLSKVTVRLKGTSSIPKTGTVALKGPDGTALQPVVPGGDAFTVALGGTADLDFVWTDRTQRPFNEHKLQLQVRDTVKNRVIFNDDALPLDFLLISKATTAPVIDGNLQDWSDAYPIHLSREEHNASGLYDHDDLDATAYLKWDSANLYVAVDVTDQIHKAAEPPSGIWKNDSIQIGIDPLNDKGGGYKADDVDFGLALNDFGQLLGYVFVASAPNQTGVIPNTVQFQIVRDNPNGKTYYEAKIPADSIVKGLLGRLAAGNKIGYNMIVNDSDFQDGRQNYVFWTRGIAESKNPSLFDSFTLIDP
ncbi:sugar-binding protein [Paenibacillus hodogayensis]|uniref:Sugar-binding protein n=1 Tax=Paenibacillus hodogayensis TaxID=279208 RepID=A0ABV5VRF8_9BACL